MSANESVVLVHGLFGSFCEPATVTELARAAVTAPDLCGYGAFAEGNFSIADAFWSRPILKLDAATAEAEITGRLHDLDGFLAADGIDVTPESRRRARAALAYQPWKTVWQSAQVVVNAISGPEYEAMLKRVFASKPVHLISGKRSRRDWHVPAWAKASAASSNVLSNAGHMLMLEQPAAFGRLLREVVMPAGRRPESSG